MPRWLLAYVDVLGSTWFLLLILAVAAVSVAFGAAVADAATTHMAVTG